VAYARDGFPVAEIVADQWREAIEVVSADPVAAAVFLPNGRAPLAGEIFRNPDLATTLERIGAEGRDLFYKGPLGAAIAEVVGARGGFLDASDLAAHTVDWVEPIQTNYRGYDICELPPNTQGFVALEMLNILEGYDLRSMGHNSAEYLHVLVEAKRDRVRRPLNLSRRSAPRAVIGACRADLQGLRAARRREIDPRVAPRPVMRRVRSTDAAIRFISRPADGAGTPSPSSTRSSAVRLWHRRSGHRRRAAQPRRWLHARAGASQPACAGQASAAHLVPGFLMKNGRPLMPFGVMGADNQAQGARPDRGQRRGLRHERAGSRRCGARTARRGRADGGKRHRR
jgi:gamma-glutamyltranspeptidase/glutathione hydrolase